MHDEIYSIDDKIAKLEADNKKIKKQSEKSKFDLSDKVVNQNIVPEQVQQEKNNTNDDDLKNDPVWIEMAKIAEEPIEEFIAGAKKAGDEIGVSLKEIPMVPMRRYVEKGLYDLEEFKQDCEDVGLSEEEALNMSTFEFGKKMYEYNLQQEQNVIPSEQLEIDPVQQEQNNTVDATPEIAECISGVNPIASL